MHKELLERLSAVTEEEKSALKGEPLDWTRYDHTGKKLVDPGVIIPDGALFYIRPHTRYIEFPHHTHRYVEMIYQIKGSTTHIIDSVKTVRLEAGMLLFLSRGTGHSIQAAGTGDIAVNFILIPAFFDNAAVSMGSGNALSVFLKGNLKTKDVAPGDLIYNISGNILIENLLENLIEGQYRGIPIPVQQLTLEVLLCHLSGMTENIIVSTQKDREQAVVLEVLARMERHVQLNLTEIADEFGMNISALSRLIKKHTGCTFTELLQTARFNRAVVLMRETELSVAEIAAAVGYENTSFFYRRFSARYGCTPGEYKALLRGDNAKSDTFSEI